MTNTPTSDSIIPWADGLYSLKRHGLTLTNCESEPVHMPGCIQAHGALLVVRLADLVILQVSENSLEFFGETSERLLSQSAVSVLGTQGYSQLQSALANNTIERMPLYL